MQLNVMSQNIDIVARQRNVFMVLCGLSMVCLLLVCMRLLNVSEKTILVPGLHQEAWTSDNKVSASYLEENATMYLPLLVDLDPTSIDWKRDKILSHVATTDPESLRQIRGYFSTAKEQYEKLKWSTHFALKKLETDTSTLKVLAHGQLVNRFGESGYQMDPVIYALSFEWISGRLLLKEFVKVSKEELND